jgi:2',3'-cyclic-nucleotide 2'-phosphodiesterase (5'-nucleotidase family)
MTMFQLCPRSWALTATIAVASLFAGGCGSGKAPADENLTRESDGDARTLVILHTNDIHGKFRDTPATWVDGEPPIGGFSNLSAHVEAERAAAPGRTVLIDAGDLMTGNPICDMEHEEVSGGAMMAFMNMMDYDAMALGNHEFDKGLDELDGLMDLATFPVLSANTYRPGGEQRTAPASHVILERNGLRIGVIGLMTESLYSVAAPSKLAGTVVTSTVEEAQRIVDAIDPETDLIILLTHVGIGGDRYIARNVENVDVIVGGHSHTRLEEPEVENGVLIVQAGAHGRNLGRLEVTVANDVIADYEGRLIELWPEAGGRDEIVAMVDAYSARIDADFGQEIGALATAWDREYHGESNIGNWITDQLRAHTNADFAVLNSGGIRKDVGSGPITKLDILEVLPFSNVVTTFTCTGEELLTMMRHNAHAAVHESHGILQVSGIRYRYVVSGDDVEIVEALVGGKPVDPAATYTGASVDYVTHGNAERLLGFEPSSAEIEGTVISAVMMEAAEAAGRIDARVEGRMVDATGAEMRRAG